MKAFPKGDTLEQQTTRTADRGGLKEYSRLKLELASTIRSVMQLARRRNDEIHEADCRKLLARLAEDRFHLAVVGQFNRGKTSLMNALLGLDRLPTGVLPLTSVVTTVCYGDRERALIQLKDSSLRLEIRLEDLPRFVTERHNPGNAKQVVVAEVQLPADLLRYGFFFIDTPGVGSLIAANTATTRGFLPEIDAAIFVTSFESPLTEEELKFFQEVWGHARTMFVVLNKADLVTLEERERILGFVRATLKQKFEADLPVFALSARDGLDAKLAGSDRQLAHSGLLELERALARFLRTEKAGALLRNATDRVEGLLQARQTELDVAERATGDPAEAALAEQQFRTRTEQLRREQEQLLAPLSAELESELISRFDGELAVWRQDVHALLVEQARKLMERSDFLVLLGAPELAAQISAACQQRARTWFAERQENFQRVICELVGDYAETLDRFAAQARATGSRALVLPPDGVKCSDVIDRVPVLYADPPPFYFPWRARWCIHALPLRFIKARVLRHCSKILEERLSAYSDEMRFLLQSLAREWVDRLRLQLAESLSASTTRVEKILRAKPEPEERSAITHCLTTLKALKNAIADLEATTEREIESADGELVCHRRSEPAARSDALAHCVLCSRIEQELFKFMSERQYELSTSENERLDHTERGGFCAAHTWHYEAMASAYGICTAYPPILTSLSRRLHSLAQPEKASGAVTEDVMRLLAQPPTCSACELMSLVEQEGAKEIVASWTAAAAAGRADLPELCLPHSYSVLGAKPDEDLARLLALEQSRALEVLAEDMERYALNRDARRGQLATEGEWLAYRRGLSHLVGSRTLSRPWKKG